MVLRIPFRLFGLHNGGTIDFPFGFRLLYCTGSSAKHKQITMRYPNDIRAGLVFAFLLSLERRYSDAIKEYFRCVELADKLSDEETRVNRLAEIYYNLSSLYHDMGIPHEEFRCLEIAANSGNSPLAVSARNKLIRVNSSDIHQRVSSKRV